MSRYKTQGCPILGDFNSIPFTKGNSFSHFRIRIPQHRNSSHCTSSAGLRRHFNMIPARSYRYTALLVVVCVAALPFLYRFGNFSADSSPRNWSFPKEIFASPFSRNTANSYYSNFQINVEQANYTEDAPIHVPPGIVSLEPMHIARVVYDGDTWSFKCQTSCKETIVPPHHSQHDFCRR
jgi:hypothetical protein